MHNQVFVSSAHQRQRRAEAWLIDVIGRRYRLIKGFDPKRHRIIDNIVASADAALALLPPFLVDMRFAAIISSR